MVSFGKTGGGSTQPTSVWNQQAPYLQSLYGMGLGMAQSQLGLGGGGGTNYQSSTQQPSQMQAQSFGGGGMLGGAQNTWQQQNQPMGGGVPGSPAGGATSMNAMNQPGNPMFNILMERATGGSPWLQSQISSLGQNIGNFYNQQIMPGINQDASFYGGTGGGRQGIAQGLAGQAALQQFQQGATGLYANDYNQGLDAALNLGMAQWSPLQNLASLIGNPAMVGGGGKQGSGFNFGFG